MHDNVPYDIFVNDTQLFRWEKPSTEARDSLNCLGDIKVDQQVIIICKSKVKPHSEWTGVVYQKFISKKNNLYQKDRKECATPRRFRAEWQTVLSDQFVAGKRKLRTNQHLVIQRLK